MSYDQLFPSFPDEARLWVYTAERPLTEPEQAELKAALADFLAGWASHRRPVQGAIEILEDRFLLVAAHLPAGDISGCGIDASVHAVEAAAQQLGLSWADPLHIFYRDAQGTVRIAPRSAFRRMAASGEVHAATPVFDVSITTLGQLRSGAFERPAGTSWHARFLRRPAPSTPTS